jgi:hypothetical protein
MYGYSLFDKPKGNHNVLLSQTIALTLNTLNDPTLAAIPISTCIVTTRGTYYIDQAIVTYLDLVQLYRIY